MDTVRGLTAWLVPPLLASICMTIVLHVAAGGDMTWSGLRPAIALAAMTLIFTVPGSALLGLSFGWTEERGVPLYGRYAIVTLLGGIAGGAAMVFWSAIPVGCAYGLATAACWVGIHRLLYRRSGARA